MGIVIAAALGGPFPLLSTPYTEKGEVDFAVLRKEAKFVADCGANGVIWPAAEDALKLLTPAMGGTPETDVRLLRGVRYDNLGINEGMF